MLVRRWTDAAIYCYKRGCRCIGCLYYEIIGKRCQMKKTVIELVKKFGKPEGIKNENIID